MYKLRFLSACIYIATGLSKFAWLARSVARNRPAMCPPPPAAPATTTAAAAAAGGGGNGGDGTVMTSAVTACDASHDDTPPQTSNVRHN